MCSPGLCRSSPALGLIHRYLHPAVEQVEVDKVRITPSRGVVVVVNEEDMKIVGGNCSILGGLEVVPGGGR